VEAQDGLEHWLRHKHELEEPDMDTRILAAKIIYTETPDSDRTVREMVAGSLVAFTAQLEDHKGYMELIRELPELAIGIMRAQRLAAKRLGQ
jgi:hypothetical protein